MSDSFKVGVHFLWKTLGIIILEVLSIGGLLISLAIFLAAVFITSEALGYLLFLPLILAAIVGCGAIYNIFELGKRALVVRNISISDAISEGYRLFKAHTINNFIIFALYVALSFAISMGILILLVILAIPFVGLAVFSNASLLLSIPLVIPLLFLLSLPISGFLGAVFETMYTLFYFRLLEPAPQVSSQPQTT